MTKNVTLREDDDRAELSRLAKDIRDITAFTSHQRPTLTIADEAAHQLAIVALDFRNSE